MGRRRAAPPDRRAEECSSCVPPAARPQSSRAGIEHSECSGMQHSALCTRGARPPPVCWRARTAPHRCGGAAAGPGAAAAGAGRGSAHRPPRRGCTAAASSAAASAPNASRAAPHAAASLIRSASSLSAAGRDARVRSCLQGPRQPVLSDAAVSSRRRRPARCAPWQQLPAGPRVSRAQGAHVRSTGMRGRSTAAAASQVPQSVCRRLRGTTLSCQGLGASRQAACGARGLRAHAGPPPTAAAAASAASSARRRLRRWRMSRLDGSEAGCRPASAQKRRSAAAPTPSSGRSSRPSALAARARGHQPHPTLHLKLSYMAPK